MTEQPSAQVARREPSAELDQRPFPTDPAARIEAGEVEIPPTTGDVLSGVVVTRDRDGLALEAMRAKLAARMDALHSAPEPQYTPEDVREDVLAHRRVITLEVFDRLVATWPTGDFSDATLEGLDDEQGAAELRAWVDDPGARTVVLNGDVGRGKTHAAFALLRHFAHQGLRVRAWSEARYLNALRPDGGDMPAWQVRKYADTADVFLLDDLGAGRDLNQPVKEFVATEIGELISGRLAPGPKRLIVTTNLNPDELGVLYGPRIMSRLVQQATPVWVEGEDRRPTVLPKSWGGRPTTRALGRAVNG